MTATDVRRPTAPLLPPGDGGPRRRRLVLALVLVVVLAAVVVWVVAFSSVLGVRTVEVRGNRTVSTTEIERAADVPHGAPLVRLDTAPIVARVEALPQVASARVETSMPSTVTVTVTERTPVGYVLVAGRPMLVDRTGTQYLGVPKAPAGLPKLVVPGRTAGAVARVAASLPADLRARTTAIEALDRDAITLVLRAGGRGSNSADGTGGTVVRWGSAARSELKARIVDVLRTQKPTPDRIDVTDPDRPFTS